MDRNHKLRNILVGAVAALAVGGGIGTAALAQAADPTASPTPSASSTATAGQQDQQGQNGQPGEHRGGPRGEHGPGGMLQGDEARAVADKLGIDQTTLTDAAKAVAEELRPTTPPAQGTRPDMQAMKDQFETRLAEQLGVDKAALASAIDEARTAAEASHKAEHRTELQQKLARAVTDGKVTQADADSVLKAFDAGVLGGR